MTSDERVQGAALRQKKSRGNSPHHTAGIRSSWAPVCRRWLLVAVFLLGLSVIALADIAYIVSVFSSGPIPAVVDGTGGSIALIAGVRALGTLSTTE